MIGVAIAYATVAVHLMLHTNMVARRFPCDCGRTRIGYFRAGRHVVGGLMLARAIALTAVLVAGLLFMWTDPLWLTLIGAGFIALMTAWMWRCWWLHEKDRLKRAAKALGRVVVDVHGRLRIAPPRLASASLRTR